MCLKFLTACPIAWFFAITNAFATEPPSSLADAAEGGNREAVGELLKQSADVNAPQVDGMTALHWAVYRDELPIASQLVAASADVNLENQYGVKPLSLACMNGNAAIVELLLKAGADPQTSLRGGETVLLTAARTGDVDCVRALLAQGADVNARERRGQTALMWAAAEGHVDVVDALLQAGADFSTPLDSGFTPLLFAVREGKTDVVMRLLKAGADVNEAMHPKSVPNKGAPSGMSPLLLAVENGHLSLALALLEAGADPNDNRLGYTALHAITWVRKPIRGDGDPSPIGSGTLTSLEFVRELVAHGADVNAQHSKQRCGRAELNKTGITPFLLAARTADIPLMKLLLELGADPNISNSERCTPLLAAAGVGVLSDGDESAATEEEAIEAVKMLLGIGADINAVDDNGETAVHGAAYLNWPNLVEFLSEHGADVHVWNRKNKHGWTPLLIAEGHRPANFRPSPETIRAIQVALGHEETEARTDFSSTKAE